MVNGTCGKMINAGTIDRGPTVLQNEILKNHIFLQLRQVVLTNVKKVLNFKVTAH